MNNKLFVNKLQAEIMHVNATNNYIIVGRGGGKSTIILADILQKRAYDLPGATIGIVGHTFVSLLDKVLPAILSGLKKMGYKEGIHFVVEQRPPRNWPKPIFPVLDFKHTIIWHTGTTFVLISQDRPASANSYSLQYLLGDEVKFLKVDKLKEEISFAVRGERLTFPNSPHLFGETFTTDMPRLEDADWLLNMQGKVDPIQNQIIFETSLLLNDLYYLREIELKNKNQKKVQSLTNSIAYFEKEINKLRFNSTYFKIASSFVNLDVIGWDRLVEWADPANTPIDIFLTSVLSIRNKKAESMFYAKLSNTHFYSANYNGYYDRFGIGSEFQKSCLGDSDLHPNKELIIGQDFGNMNSLVVLQQHPNEIRALKNFYVLKPEEGLTELAKKFVEYYRPHPYKTLQIYYDRAGNKFNEQTKKSNAEYFSSKILEFDSKWNINLKSIGIGNIPHDLKDTLWTDILSEKDNKFPRFRLNEDNCPELKSSMLIAPRLINEKNKVEKVKTSEKKDIKLLPMWSTNLSDALDYPIYQLYSHLILKSVARPYKAKVY